MARWWKLVVNGARADELTDNDFEHIADLVKQGYTEGDLLSDDGYETTCANCGMVMMAGEAACKVETPDGDTFLYCTGECRAEHGAMANPEPVNIQGADGEIVKAGEA